MANFILHILKLNLLAGGCILIILLLSNLLERRYSVKWRYFLWMIISIVLLLPIQLPEHTAVIQVEVPHRTSLSLQQLSEDVNYPENNTMLNSVSSGQTHPSPTIEQYFLFAWIALALLIFFFHIIRYYAERKNLIRWSTPLPDSHAKKIYKELCKRNSLRHAPKLVMNTKISTPLLAGIISPVLYLPNIGYSDAELEIIFSHELCHYRSKDIWYKTLLLFVTTVYWFNPLLYKMTREAARDIEFLCDEKVTLGKDRSYRILYNQLLLKTAVSSKKYTHYLYAGLNDNTSKFKKRFVNIMRMNTVKKGVIPASMITSIFLACNIVLGFSFESQNPANTASELKSEAYENTIDVLFPKELTQDETTTASDMQETIENVPIDSVEDSALVTPAVENNAEATPTIAPTTVTPSPTQSPTPTETPEQPAASTIQVCAGSYIDNKRYNPENTDSYCEVYVSNVTENSFDFTVYEVNDASPEQKALVLDTNTAVFSEDGTQAIASVNGQTVAFSFPDNHASYPIATDMTISGIDTLEGNSYANNGIPGYEFG